VALVSALVGGAVGAVVVALAGNNGTSGPSLTVREGNAVPGAAQLAGNVTIPQLVHQVLPAVVSIDVKAGGQEDQGTGMILSPDGSVVTNYHVVALSAAEGGTITVTRSGQVKAQPATLVGTDPANDVALLHVTGASGLPTVVFGNSTRAGVGDAVVAIGNALGLAAGTPTVTSGIISAKGRTVQAADSTGSGAETLTDMLQTDAAINPGNSGGPLIDTEGQVIGMNTAVAGTTSDGTSAQNIGFAIPSARIESLLPELERGGVSRGGGYLGVDVTTLTPALRQQYGFTPKTGAVVLDVASGSPAETAGLQSGDVITEVNGTTVTNADQLQNAVQKAKANEHIELTYYQGANKKTVGVTLGSQALAQQQQQQQQAQSGGFGSIPGFGGASPFG
jgi:S1-C subfamily serine protease